MLLTVVQAYHALKGAAAALPPGLQAQALALIRDVQGCVRQLPCPDQTATTQGLLDLHRPHPDPEHAAYYPFMDCLPRKDDITGLEGPLRHITGYTPINVLSLTGPAGSPTAAMQALARAEDLCTLLFQQRDNIPQHAFLRAAVLQHLFTHVLPVPLGPESRRTSAASPCLWAEPVPYAQQLAVGMALRRLACHFVAAMYSLEPSRGFHAVAVVVLGAAAAMCDANLRRLAPDLPSGVSRALEGEVPGARCGVGPGQFGAQSETIQVTAQELNVVRTRILDYFEELAVPPQQQFFNWEAKAYYLEPEPALLQFLKAVGGPLCCEAKYESLCDGDNTWLLFRWPELVAYRCVGG